MNIDLDYIKKNIYYLNILELKQLTEELDIPINIYMEKQNNYILRTNQIDLKDHIITKILKYLINNLQK